MRNARIPSLVIGVLLSVLASPAKADQVVISGGGIGAASPSSGTDWEGFELTSSDSSFTGVTASGFVPPPPFGGLADLNGVAGLVSTIPFPLATPQLVHGTAYLAFITGSLTFTTTPFVIPPPAVAGTSFAFSTPFSATGQIAGRATNDPNAPVLFSVDLSGSGTATVRGVVSDQAHPFYNAMFADYRFAASVPASTPEPSSLMLLLATAALGAAGFFTNRCVSFWS